MALVGKIAAAGWLASAFCLAQDPRPAETPGSSATFGVTVVDSLGLEGKLYLLRPDTDSLPNFKRLKLQGTIYTTSLNIPLRRFVEGFPGITDRFEWFALDYNGRFWIRRPGIYRFSLLSDDGSKLYIDGHVVIDNDGLHAAQAMERSRQLAVGVHTIRVSYFQGPGDQLALVLGVAGPGEPLRIFDTRDFRPPNPDEGK